MGRWCKANDIGATGFVGAEAVKTEGGGRPVGLRKMRKTRRLNFIYCQDRNYGPLYTFWFFESRLFENLQKGYTIHRTT
jgi:hypothetical protein